MSRDRPALITYQANGARVPGYLADPGADSARPGPVVIQEWWGLNPQIMDVADRFASEG